MLRNLAASCLIAVSLGGCLGPSRSGSSFEAIPRVLDAKDPQRTRLGEAEVLGILQLNSPERWFGGISGLAFDGHSIVGVNDTGHWLRFDVDMDAEGRPVAVGNLAIASLAGLDGSKTDGDAEDLTWTPQGWVVSFERRHRLLLYPKGLSGKPVRLSAPQGFSRQPDNGGIEALATLKDGRMLMLSEEGVDEDGTGWAWIGASGAWERLGYRREGLFQPTSAAVLPNGDVLVTERRFTLLGGVALRLVRIAVDGIRPGAVLDGHELFRLEPPMTVDNYEGIAVQQRADGRIVAYIMSDNNFNPLQQTLLMSVLLPE